MGQSEATPIGDVSDVKTLNSAEQGTRSQALAGMLQSAGGYDNFLKSLMSGQSSREQGIADAASSYNPEAANARMMALSPELQGIAQNAAATSLSPYGDSAKSLAAMTTRDAIRDTSSQLGSSGLLNSGAANAAMFEAALRPQQEMQTNLAKMQSDYSQNTFNNLLGLSSNSLNQGYSQQGAQNMSAAQSAMDSYLQAQGLYGNALGAQGQMYGSLADLTQQQYWQPQYTQGQSTGTSIANGLTGAMSGAKAGSSIPGLGGWGTAGGAGLGFLAGLFS